MPLRIGALYRGSVSEWLKEAVCKIVGVSLHKFKSCPAHQFSKSPLSKASAGIYLFRRNPIPGRKSVIDSRMDLIVADDQDSLTNHDEAEQLSWPRER